MKPDVQKILTKLAKEQEKEDNVKLEKVELGIADEMKRAEKIVTAMKVTAKAFEKEMNQAQKKIDDIIYMLDTGSLDKAYINPAKQIKKELEKAGLTNIPIYSDLKNYTPMFERTIEGAEKFKDKLKGISLY